MATPKDIKLYNKIKKEVYSNIPKHSAYRSGILVKKYKQEYKEKYGNGPPYLGKKTRKKGFFLLPYLAGGCARSSLVEILNQGSDPPSLPLFKCVGGFPTLFSKKN